MKYFIIAISWGTLSSCAQIKDLTNRVEGEHVKKAFNAAGEYAAKRLVESKSGK